MVSDLKRQELIIVLVSGFKGAEGEDDIMDVEHLGGHVLVPSVRCHHECVMHLVLAAVEHERI